jgi:hypothetical protein
MSPRFFMNQFLSLQTSHGYRGNRSGRDVESGDGKRWDFIAEAGHPSVLFDLCKLHIYPKEYTLAKE